MKNRKQNYNKYLWKDKKKNCKSCYKNEKMGL